MALWHDEGLDAYCMDSVDEPLAKKLVSLQWTLYPNSRVWITRNPYHACPLWEFIAPSDTRTQSLLNSYAYNYQTSFAEEPLRGTGVDSLQVRPKSPKLFGFQVAGTQLLANRPRVILGDEMGLGKTSQFIQVCNLHRPERVLIACPTFLMFNWAAELEKWCSFEAPITILNRPGKAVPEKGFVIIPYSRAFSYWPHLIASGPFDKIGLDEMHYLKGKDSKRVKPFFGSSDETGNYPGVVHYSGQTIGITGTPVPNNPSDAYNPIVALRPDILGGMTREDFNRTYCTSYDFAGQEVISGGMRESALNAELRASGLLVRRLKKNVLSQLPPKNRYLVQLEPTKDIAQLVRREAELYEMAKLHILTSKELEELVGHIATVRKELALAKAPKIFEYTKNIMDGGVDRLLLFMWHTDAINDIAERFRRTTGQIQVHVVDGRANVTLRQSAVEQFQSDSPVPQLFIGQIKAAGVGLTLTKSSRVIMGEISWVPSDNIQAEDRTHRISQTEQVDVSILSYPHSVESKVVNSAATKEISNGQILDENLIELLSKFH